MPRLSLNRADDAQLLRTYKLSTLNPTKWEDVDYELEDSVADSIFSSASSTDEREGDPLGLPHSLSTTELNTQTKAAVAITSKSFDPSTYLSVVHPEATYHDLTAGIAFLRHSVEARSEALRILVEENFDRFVAVKATTEGLHEDMKTAILSKETDFCCKPLKDHLKMGMQKANQIFIPVLDGASKTQKLCTTLTLFQRSRFFFNLPSFIMECIDAGRYDMAIRDYKKGKYVLENRPSQLLPIGSIKDEPASATAQQRQKRILNKVWATVEKAMAELKKVLVAQLQDPGRSVEEHEKTLDTLIEFQSSDEPLWTYFDTQSALIVDRISSAYQSSVKGIEVALSDTQPLPDDQTPEKELQRAMSLMQENMDESLIAKSAGETAWHAVLNLVKNLSDAMTSSLPSFWAISKRFIDGKFKKPTTSTSRSPAQCRTMAHEIVKVYVSLISQAFMLSDVVVMISTPTDARPPLLSVQSHSFSTAYYLQRILSEVQDGIDDIKSLDISNEINHDLKNTMESLRWRFECILTVDWLRDANLFYHLESWTLDPKDPSVTSYLSHFELFQRHMAVTAYKIAAGSEMTTPGTSPTTLTSVHRRPLSKQKSGIIPQTFMSKIRRAFMDALYAFLDGLVLLAGEESPIVLQPLEARQQLKGTESAVETRLHDLLDLKDPNVRLLLVLWNLKHFGKVVIPGMITQLEAACGVSLADDRQTLMSVLKELDNTLFTEYVKPRAAILVQRIQDNILGGRIDWYTAPEPKYLRPYVLEIMNYLVTTHAEVCNVAEGLLDQTLNALLDELVKELIRCFGQVKQFGTGGLLTAVMEMTFLQKSLGSYGKDTAAGMKLEDLYTQRITQAYSPLSAESEFERSFEAMQNTLAEARKATLVQYLCFRRSIKSDYPSGESGMANTKEKRIQRRVKENGRVEMARSG